MFELFDGRHAARRCRPRQRACRVAIAVLAAGTLVSACDPDPPPAPPLGREALYAYCDRAAGQDPACYTPRFGNDLRAADDFLRGPDWFGGLKETTATPQGLTALPVGTTLDMVHNQFGSLELSANDAPDGVCSIRLDPNARFGVVTRRDTGARGEVDVVEAFLIRNPVIRLPDGLGVDSTLDDLQTAYPSLQVAEESGGKYATTPPEVAEETLYSTSSERVLRFRLSSENTVTEWSAGSPQFTAGC